MSLAFGRTRFGYNLEDWDTFVSDRKDRRFSEAVLYLETKWPEVMVMYQTHVLLPKVVLGDTFTFSYGTSGYNRFGETAAGCRQILSVLNLDGILQDDLAMSHLKTLFKKPAGIQERMFKLAAYAKPAIFVDPPELVTKNKLKAYAGIGPSHSFATLNAHRRVCFTCFCDQKTIITQIKAAIKNKKMQFSDFPLAIKDIDCIDWMKLRKRPSFQGKKCFPNYRISKKGRLYCTIHGFIHPPKDYKKGMSVREQLAAYGCKDEAKLDECSDVPPVPVESSEN